MGYNPIVLSVCRIEHIAQAALGHNGKAIHCARAKKAQLIVQSPEEYEMKAAVNMQ